MLATIVVFEFPPRESYGRRYNEPEKTNTSRKKSQEHVFTVNFHLEEKCKP
jgi:hypothetical protein